MLRFGFQDSEERFAPKLYEAIIMFTASVTRFGEKFATLAEISRARAMF